MKTETTMISFGAVRLIGSVLVASAIAGVGVFGVITFKPIYQQSVNNEARYECAQSSRFTTKDVAGNEVWYPVSDLYQKCLNEKGL